MLHSECRKGVRVRINCPDDLRFHGRLGTIDKVNPANMKVKIDGADRLLVIPPMYLELDSSTAPPVELVPFVAVPAPGTVVRVDSEKLLGLYVVIGEGTRGGHTVAKVAKLGGEDYRTWSVPGANVKAVDLPTVKELLPA